MTAATSPTSSAGSADGPRVRKDVARNRALLLSTADKLIAERGLEMTFHDLAAAAGVGVGTVYRHFTDKDALLGALIERRFDHAAEILLAAEQTPDPVRAFREAVLGICELQQHDRAVWQAMLSDVERHRALAESRLLPQVGRLVERALATGRVRADLAATDMPVMFWLSGALNQFSADVRPDLWRRYVELLLDGLMTDPADRDGHRVPALTRDELDRVHLP